MPDFQRDIRLSGGANDYFVAPGNYDYWLYNPPTNASVTISKAGKAPQVISAGEVFVLHLSKGEELALSGTAGQILSIYDHADVKLIPAAKEILGKVQIIGSDGSSVVGADANGLGVDINFNSIIPSVTIFGSTPLLINPFGTPAGSAFMPPTSVNAGTAETVKATASLVGGPARVFYNLSAGPVTTLTTAADTLTYIAIKGHTSNNYYAVAFLEANITGVFDSPATGFENLDLVYRNQDTAAHTFAGAIWALFP